MSAYKEKRKEHNYWIKQWNGELPSTVLGESMSYMVDLGLSSEEVK